MLGEDIMEYFELTFFCPKNVYNKESIGFIADNFNFYDNFEKNIHVEFFSEEEKDFDEFCVNLSDFKLRKDNFVHIFKQLSQHVGSIFNTMDKVYFVTGIYELTYYFTENLKSITQFDPIFMQKFPIVIYKTGQNYDSGEILYSDTYVTCVFHKEAQNLY